MSFSNLWISDSVVQNFMIQLFCGFQYFFFFKNSAYVCAWCRSPSDARVGHYVLDIWDFR
jgi:hypothetical protein